MSDPSSRPPGVTVVLCAAAGCHGVQHDPLREVLRAVVRSTHLGVLVLSGCLLRGGVCARRTAGALVAVQPCDEERRPVAPLVLVGPVRTAGDVAAVREWLSAGRFDPAVLHAGLVDPGPPS